LKLSEFLSSSLSEFQTVGPAQWNARQPYMPSRQLSWQRLRGTVRHQSFHYWLVFLCSLCHQGLCFCAAYIMFWWHLCSCLAVINRPHLNSQFSPFLLCYIIYFVV